MKTLLLIALSGMCWAQTKVSLKSQGKEIDFGNAVSTRPVKVGLTPPASCAVGDLFFKSDAIAGVNLMACTAVNSWTQLGEPGGVLPGPKVSVAGGVVSVTGGAARIGSAVYLYGTVATATAPTGSGGPGPYTVYFYISADGTRTMGVDGNNVTGATVSGLGVQGGVTAMPGPALPLAACEVMGGVFQNCTDLRAAGREIVEALDASVLITQNSSTGRQGLAANPAMVALTDANNNMVGRNRVTYEYLSLELTNDAVATAMGRLAVLTAAGSVTVAPVSADGRIIGVCVAGCGATGFARVATHGVASCEFDGPTTAGNYVQSSGTDAGKCHDAGATRPTSGQILGYVLATGVSAQTYPVLLEAEIR